MVTAWVFMDGDAPDDTIWIYDSMGLENSSLIPEPGCTGNNMIDDRGFIVRLDNDQGILGEPLLLQLLAQHGDEGVGLDECFLQGVFVGGQFDRVSRVRGEAEENGLVGNVEGLVRLCTLLMKASVRSWHSVSMSQ